MQRGQLSERHLVTEQVYRPLNQSVERMGASRLGQFRYLRQRRLPPVAHARR